MLSASKYETFISARISEYAIPPLKDMLVLGKNAPIGCIAMRRALELLIKAPFEHIEVDDDIISDILVRQSLLRRTSREALAGFVLKQIKPLLGEDEILQVEMDVKISLTTGIE
ncbi:MAG: hypothetical protein CVV13_06735 [Gammaproteobacteria bacterium HGW-Gammaproteobacteria-3]|nr:MAG: hypothetical protein CVV13_06735 [Gammaproteobacteria bacterium HGW-Gammaproteobacteria-3]